VTEQNSVNDPEQRALDNIPEFSEGSSVTEYDHMKAHYDRIKNNEHARIGAAMFASGVIEGLQQAIHAIETEKRDVQPSRNWAGMNAAVAAVEQAIARLQTPAGSPQEQETDPS